MLRINYMNAFYEIDYWISQKSQNASVPYPTLLHSEQKCTHFCSERSNVGYGIGALWDVWIKPIVARTNGSIGIGDSTTNHLNCLHWNFSWWWAKCLKKLRRCPQLVWLVNCAQTKSLFLVRNVYRANHHEMVSSVKVEIYQKAADSVIVIVGGTLKISHKKQPRRECHGIHLMIIQHWYSNTT